MTLTRWSAVLAAGAGLLCLALAVLLAYEAWALWVGEKPITSYVREWGAAHPQWELLAVAGIGLLLGHFLWRGDMIRRSIEAEREASR